MDLKNIHKNQSGSIKTRKMIFKIKEAQFGPQTCSNKSEKFNSDSIAVLKIREARLGPPKYSKNQRSPVWDPKNVLKRIVKLDLDPKPFLKNRRRSIWTPKIV